MPDCILPDDVDLLGDCDIDLAIEELIEERDKLLQELQAQGLTSKDSARYKTLGNRISYLRNRDKIRMREKRKYKERKRSP